jgi:SAM-dependent methyltransferase
MTQATSRIGGDAPIYRVPDSLFLKPGYRSREQANYFVDDAGSSDGRVHQPDVYPFAAHLARGLGVSWLVDVGCGRAEKSWAYCDELKIAGIDTGENISYCRRQFPTGFWSDVDFERPGRLPLSNELLRDSVVVCSDVIEHLVDPRPLLSELARVRESAAMIVVSTPERDLVRGLEDPGPPPNPFHVREWSLPELVSLLTAAGLAPMFAGLTNNNDVDLQKRTSIAVIEGRRTPALELAPPEFRVLAVVTAYNEQDIVPHTIGRLLADGIEVVLVDNWSTDGTQRTVRERFGDRVRVLRCPEHDTGTYDWSRLLEEVERLGRESGADWVVHHDADELRQGPWEGLGLRDSLWNVQLRGFNAVDHTVINFRPVQGEEPPDGDDPTQSLVWWEFGRRGGHFVQVKAWRNFGQPVALAESGGHEAVFEGRRVAPWKFLLRHYPIRSASHGRRKVTVDRRPRWNASERRRGWHTQYDSFSDDATFLWDAAELERWDPGRWRSEYLVERLSGVGIVRGTSPT